VLLVCSAWNLQLSMLRGVSLAAGLLTVGLCLQVRFHAAPVCQLQLQQFLQAQHTQGASSAVIWGVTR
jgi:hypothetical protein